MRRIPAIPPAILLLGLCALCFSQTPPEANPAAGVTATMPASTPATAEADRPQALMWQIMVVAESKRLDLLERLVYPMQFGKKGNLELIQEGVKAKRPEGPWSFSINALRRLDWHYGGRFRRPDIADLARFETDAKENKGWATIAELARIRPEDVAVFDHKDVWIVAVKSSGRWQLVYWNNLHQITQGLGTDPDDDLPAATPKGAQPKYYEDLLERWPDDAAVRSNLGVVLIKGGKKKEGIEQLHKALEYNPRDLDVIYNLGVMAAREGNREEAIELYRRALAIDNRYFGAKFNLAVMLQDMGKYEEAAELYVEILAREPNHAYTLGSLGYAYLMLGKIEESKKAFGKAARLDPKIGQFYLDWAKRLEKQGKSDEAKRMREMATAWMASTQPASSSKPGSRMSE